MDIIQHSLVESPFSFAIIKFFQSSSAYSQHDWTPDPAFPKASVAYGHTNVFSPHLEEREQASAAKFNEETPYMDCDSRGIKAISNHFHNGIFGICLMFNLY